MTRNVRQLADIVWAIVDAIPNLSTYRGQFIDDNGDPADPPVDPDGRVHPYAIIYFNGGRAHSRRLGARTSNLDWGFQITCAGGDDERCLDAVNAVRGALTGKLLTIGSGIKPRRLIEDSDPGPLRRDEDVHPSRMYLPLLFRTQI